ncbi:sensor histidine kinase [Phytohabitans rumicis]|uniref:histidine kinase n=1 Tax=Phytohabitans rumicis TaxID=1076125 RepID=A0A6V8LIT5_9ACTN|nr:sensor histidine kinase [Phytohabitans rumicis]GFJ96114.1 histidine kinase [Phytohabitans rumicis]
MRGRLLHLVLGAPLGVLGFGYLYVVIAAAGVLLVTLVGLPVLATGLAGARRLGRVHVRLAGRLLDVHVTPPPSPPVLRPGLIGWVRARLTDADAWRAALYLLLKLPHGLLGLATILLFWGYGLVFVTAPIWRPADLFSLGGLGLDTWPRLLILALVGVGLLAAAPRATAAVTALDGWLLRSLLGPTRASRLRRSRTAAVDDATARLRRIERDLHDGAQAQLVALAMHLGLAREELADGDAPAALALLDTAHAGAKRAIVELRDLARGVYPPVLDSGIQPAIESLAARSAVPVHARVALAERPSPAIEVILYFSAAELLANAAKHSRARQVTLVLAVPRPGWLRLTVRDDGIGGARPGPGLSGLTERIGTVDGTLTLTSPGGGPTTVSVDVPVHA